MLKNTTVIPSFFFFFFFFITVTHIVHWIRNVCKCVKYLKRFSSKLIFVAKTLPASSSTIFATKELKTICNCCILKEDRTKSITRTCRPSIKILRRILSTLTHQFSLAREILSTFFSSVWLISKDQPRIRDRLRIVYCTGVFAILWRSVSRAMVPAAVISQKEIIYPHQIAQKNDLSVPRRGLSTLEKYITSLIAS